MAGNTGKMTREAVESRGPRMVLWDIHRLLNCRTRRVGFAITRDGKQMPVPYMHYAHGKAHRYAMSYSLSYLLRLARAAKELA